MFPQQLPTPLQYRRRQPVVGDPISRLFRRQPTHGTNTGKELAHGRRVIVYRAAVIAQVVTVAIRLFRDPEKTGHLRHGDGLELGNVISHTWRNDDQHVFAAKMAVATGHLLPLRSFLQASICVH